MQYQTGAQNQSRSTLWGLQRSRPLGRVAGALVNWALVDDHQAVLELGMVNGALLEYLSDKYLIRACGISFDPEWAQHARQNLPGAEVIYAPGGDIPWRDASFDRVLVSAPLPGRRERQNWSQEVLRTLKPGGKLLMALPVLGHDGTARTLKERFIRPKDLLKRLSKEGFEDVSYRYAVPTHAIMIASKPI